MKTIDGKIVDVGYYKESVIDNNVIVSETRNQVDYAYYSSIAAIREHHPKATISLIIDDYSGEKVFTLKQLKEWVAENIQWGPALDHFLRWDEQ